MTFIPNKNNRILTEFNSAPLTSGQTFTSAYVDVLQYTDLVISIFTDKNSLLNLDFSSDGVNLDANLNWIIDANVGQVHKLVVTARYIRIRLTNLATTNQTILRTQYTLGDYDALTFALSGNNIPDTWDAVVGRSIVTGENPAGEQVNNKVDGLIASTMTPLSASGVYNSGVFSTEGYTQIQIEFFADKIGIATFVWYSDSGTSVVRNASRSYDADDVARGLFYFSGPVLAPFLRVLYTNGPSAQTQFYFATKLITKPISGHIVGLVESLPVIGLANLGRNVVVGQDTAGNFKNVGVDSGGRFKISVDSPLTSFGELKTAEMTPIIQVIQPYGINTDLVSSSGTTGGSLTYSSSTISARIGSGAGTNSVGKMRTIKLAKYRNGQGLAIRFTSIFATPVAGNTQFAGWGDEVGGFFFGYSGTSFGINRRVNSTDNFTPQSGWTVDKMNGSGDTTNPSDVLLNPQMGNVYEIQVQWLGYGAVKYGIESQFTGNFEPVHIIQYANQNSSPSTNNPTYPIYFESKNTTNNTNVVITTSSMAAMIEGKVSYVGPTYSFDGATASAANKPMLTLTNPLTFNGVPNKTRALIKTISLVADGANTVVYTLVKNPTFSVQPVYSAESANTPISGASTGTWNVGTGTSIFKTLLNKVDSKDLIVQDLEYFLNPGEVFSFITQGVNASSTISITWVDDI